MTVQLPADALILGAAALLAAGVLGVGFANRMRVPGLLLFLGIGMLIGDDGLNLVSLADPLIAQAGGSIALLLILFEGGLTTKPGDIRRAAAPGALLATVGVVLTAGAVAAGTYVLLDVSALTAMLTGAVVASTDAAAVFTVMRRAPLPRRLTALLEVESGSNDPAAIMLTVGLLEAWRAQPTAVEALVFGVTQLGGGLLVGVAVGLLGSWMLRHATLDVGLYPVLALGVAGLAYGLAAQLSASGFLAVYVTGILVGAQVPRHRRSIRTFFDGLANTAEIGLFLLMGLLVFPSQLVEVALPAVAVALVLVLVARPLAVHVCLPWFGFTFREQVLVAWTGLRGAVPIVLATFPLAQAHPDGARIFNLVFFVVLLSTAVQGLTVDKVARRLGLTESARPWAPVAEALPLEGVDADLVEVDITPELYINGKLVREVPLPPGGLMTAVVRGSRTVVPVGDTRLRAGDLLLVAMPRRPTATEEVVAWARGERWPVDAA